MNRQHLKLREIIWEITGACKNGCSYCGSSREWSEKIDEAKVLQIAERIALYPPENIDISGGDPLLISKKTHEDVVNLLKAKNVVCKILINPKSIKNLTNLKVEDILVLYDWIGISINTKEELEIFSEYIKSNPLEKYTVITNFNLDNIFLYDLIETFVKEHSVVWQIQYTMYKRSEEQLALYLNEEASQHLFDKINQSIGKSIRITMADNINDGSCTAGFASLGILSNGDVIPCLSMRSWIGCNEFISIKEGNLLDDPNTDYPHSGSLEEMWINGFESQRFNDFTCCKDHCKKRFFVLDITNTELGRQILRGKKAGELQRIDNPLLQENIMVYGVKDFREQQDPQPYIPLKDGSGVYLYGVGSGYGMAQAYAVSITDNSTGLVKAVYGVGKPKVKKSEP